MIIRSRECILSHYVRKTANVYSVKLQVRTVGANGIRPEMIVNEYGIIVRDEWIKSAEIRAEIELDEFVIMPNHVHGIVVMNDTCRGVLQYAPT